MDEFETAAFNMRVVLAAARHRIESYGVKGDVNEAISSLSAMFIVWLVASEEARIQDRFEQTKISFTEDVIQRIPEIDDPELARLISPLPTSSLRRRIESLWGIRVAFTHSNGRLASISNPKSRRFAEDAAQHIPGVCICDGKLDVSRCDLHTATRSIIQLRQVF